MNTASPSNGMITPFKALWRWLVATPGAAQTMVDKTQQLPVSAYCGNTLRNNVLHGGPHLLTPPVLRRPLRMVRVIEAGQTPSQVGRMVISGRMADVCAELDRLAAHETRLH
jgi:hypothetical protein